jgi:hypothetical protein
VGGVTPSPAVSVIHVPPANRRWLRPQWPSATRPNGLPKLPHKIISTTHDSINTFENYPRIRSYRILVARFLRNVTALRPPDELRRRLNRVRRRTPLVAVVGACRQRIELCRRTSHVRSSDVRHCVDSDWSHSSMATTVVDRFPCFGRTARVSTAVVA